MYTSWQHMHEQLKRKKGERRGATTSSRGQEVTGGKKVNILDMVGVKREISRTKGNLDKSHTDFRVRNYMQYIMYVFYVRSLADILCFPSMREIKPCRTFPLLIVGGLWLDKDPLYYITHRTPTWKITTKIIITTTIFQITPTAVSKETK